MKKTIYFITLLCFMVTSLLLCFPVSVSAVSSNLAYGAAYTTYEVLDNERYNVGLTVSGFTGSLNDGKYSMSSPVDGGSVSDWFAFRNDTTIVSAESNCVTGLGQVLFDLGAVSDIGCVKVYISTLDYYTCDYITVYAGSENQYYLDVVGILIMPEDDYGWAILNLEEVVSAQYVRLEFKVSDGNTCLIGEVQLYSAPDETDVTVENKVYTYPPLSSTAQIYYVANNDKLYDISTDNCLIGGPVIGSWWMSSAGVNSAVGGYYDPDNTLTDTYFQLTLQATSDLFLELDVVNRDKTFLCSYDYGQVDLSKYNYVSFTVYPLWSQSVSLNPLQKLAITVDGEPYYGGDIAFTRGSPIEYDIPGEEYVGTVYPYTCEIFLDDDQKLGKVKLGVQFLADLNVYAGMGSCYYAMGITSLTAEEKTQEEFVEGIASGIINIENLTEDTNETVHIISDNVTEIKEVFETTVPEEQLERIQENMEIIDDSKAEAEAVDSVFDAAVVHFDEMDYDLFNAGQPFLQEYLDPTYENDGFLSFWNGLWSHPYIVAMTMLVITFCSIGFVLYGVR